MRLSNKNIDQVYVCEAEKFAESKLAGLEGHKRQKRSQWGETKAERERSVTNLKIVSLLRAGRVTVD